MNQNELINLEKIEQKYLLKYFYFLKFVEDEILIGLNTKSDIKDDWFDKWSNSSKEARKSDFSTGAERVVYALINSKSFGVPNSCPVGSDLMFEVDDAYIHIDLKTTQISNINDFAMQFTIGNNQISYNSEFIVSNKIRDYCNANLPTIYTKNNTIKKPCLTYFLNILHDEETMEAVYSYITCFPNGLLQPIYKGEVFNAGKIVSDVRENLEGVKNFRLINGRRVLVLYINNEYINDKIKDEYKKKLEFLNACYKSQLEQF